MYRNLIPWRLSVFLLLATTCSFLLGGQLGNLTNFFKQSNVELLQLYEYSQGNYNRRMMEVEYKTTSEAVKSRSFTLDDPPPLNLRKDRVSSYLLEDANGEKRKVPDHIVQILERRRVERASRQTTMQKSLLKTLNQKQKSVQSLSLRKNNNNDGNQETQPGEATYSSKSETSVLGDGKLAIQPLLPWEQAAIETRTCQTPHRGIPKHCCPGSYSAGGRLLFMEDVCNKTGEEYEKLQEYSLDYLNKPHLATKNQNDHQCDACALVETLMGRNLTLSFVGDSLTRQTIAGLECELLRRGYMVQSKKVPVVKRSGCSWRDCLGEWVVFTVTKHHSSSAKTNDKETMMMKTSATINHFGMYRPDPSNRDLKEIILPHSDIVIFDHGLHWKPTEEVRFAGAMTRYLSGFLDANLTMLAWRETSAQHMDADGGHYGVPAKSKNCVPIHPEYQTGFRMPIMEQAAESAGLQWKSLVEPNFATHPVEANELVYLPFRDYTVPLHYLHPNECTHYCHTPYLWLPLWRSLRISLDRAVQTR